MAKIIGKKTIVTIIMVLVLVAVGAFVANTMVGYIDAKDWHFVQPYVGSARIQNGSGWYWKGFAKAFPYPRYMEFVYSDDVGEGEESLEAIKSTFNDGSTARMDAFIVIQTPDEEKDQIDFHKKMGGTTLTIKSKTKAYLTECIKVTAPLMSSTEHQVARKADFSRKVEDQLSDGIYDMRETTKVLIDRVDEAGNPVSVPATEILRDEETDKPIIAKESPLVVDYKMQIVQFSIKGTVYDEETLLQFAAKKAQFLSAETSKSEREAMVQEALKIKAEGLKDKAQAEAEANVKKATAVIAAEQLAEVALQAKVEAETKASMTLEVAKIAQEEAQVKLDIADLDAQAVIVLATAEREKIELAGALTELEEAQIKAQIQMADDVSKNLSQIPVPLITMGGNGSGSGGVAGGIGGIDPMLINLKLLTDAGVFEKLGIDKSIVDRKIERKARVKATTATHEVSTEETDVLASHE